MEGQNQYRHPERPQYPVPKKDPLSPSRGILTAVAISLGIMVVIFLALAAGEALWRVIPVDPQLRPAVACGGFTTSLACLVTGVTFRRFRGYKSWAHLIWFAALIWALAFRCWATVAGL